MDWLNGPLIFHIAASKAFFFCEIDILGVVLFLPFFPFEGSLKCSCLHFRSNRNKVFTKSNQRSALPCHLPSILSTVSHFQTFYIDTSVFAKIVNLIFVLLVSVILENAMVNNRSMNHSKVVQ